MAVAILGLGLTAILSAQFSAVSGVAHARHMSVANGLARCKMTELELQLAEEGFPEVDLEGSGACCEGDQTPNISCTWIVSRPTLPDADYGKLDLDTDLQSSALGKLSESGDTDNLNSGGDLAGLASGLAGGGDVSSALGGGVGGVAGMVMNMVYPDLKNLFEASARKITLVLTWTEGNRTYDIELIQWVTQPQPGMAVDLEGDEEADGGGSTDGGGQGAASTPGGRLSPTTQPGGRR